MNRLIRNCVLQIPQVRRLVEERDTLKAERNTWVGLSNNLFLKYSPPGHFYSPIPSMDEIKAREHDLWKQVPASLSGINLNDSGQLKLFKHLLKYYEDVPFEDNPKGALRYGYKNPSYSYSDAITLFCILRMARPDNIIEVGSGHSSCVFMDTNELFYGNSIDITFIEPYPELLLTLMKEGDKDQYKIINKGIQYVDLNVFESLKQNDILFIDSTHVSKIGGDVNHIFFQVLPRLQTGVLVHFHDMFFPFEYPKQWLYEGRAWTEDYLMRAFLQYNSAFEIAYWNEYLATYYRKEFEEYMPLCLKDTGGSLWLRKLPQVNPI